MIRLSDVVKEYESGTTALKGISLRIEDGEFVFLVGPSGSGKSTIIKLLTGEIVPTSGQIAVNGFSLTNIAERQIPLLRRSVGVIFQDFRLIEKKTVYENLSFAMRAVGSSPREIKKRIPYVLELVGLEEKTDRYPNELSGGEQQRVAIARALINNPSTIIADEPTGAFETGDRPADGPRALAGDHAPARAHQPSRHDDGRRHARERSCQSVQKTRRHARTGHHHERWRRRRL